MADAIAPIATSTSSRPPSDIAVDCDRWPSRGRTRASVAARPRSVAGADVTDRPLILLSNDDGVEARGLHALREALLPLGDVFVVAPRTEQSAGSHSLTLSRPLRHRTHEANVHSVDGTPADCIYVALYRDRLLPRRPDLVVSGINHGYNLGTDVHYSGTVAAAREAALRGIPSIAFSLARPGGRLEVAAVHARALVERALVAPGDIEGERGPLLNVNFPPGDTYRGTRATRLGKRVYSDEVDVRLDPRGNEYYWIGGPKAHHEPIEGADTEAVDAGYVSITPLLLDPTDPGELGLAAWLAGPDSEEP
ncbi:MAG: 5'/3'-nucleotidase SurE [Sandaracinaceae bacterium]|nr:5'/3'-nucleotidase SurE [Sandaracinaceae bacterium]